MDIINKVDNNSIFKYAAMFIGVTYAFSKISIGINTIFGVFVAFVVILYLYRNNIKKTEKLELLHKNKLNAIHPFPKKNKHNKDIINYLFSIQDFYKYNQQAYENMIKNIDYFFALYDEILLDNSLAGVNYGIMETNKRDAINSLKSIIFGMKIHAKYDDKLSRAAIVLDNMLQKYVNEVYEINDKYIYNNGLNTKSALIDKTTIKPANLYDDKLFSYDIA